MDATILQKEIEIVREAILAVDQRVDDVEEEANNNHPGDPAPVTEAIVAPVVDIAQTVGRLEAEVEQCRTEVQSLKSEMAILAVQVGALNSLSVQETESETEVTVTELEPEPEPEPEPKSQSDGDGAGRNPNWLERLILVR